MKDLSGKQFGQWTVLSCDESKSDRNHRYWYCKCSCGNIKSIYGANLTRGYSKSCGCMRSKGRNNPSFKHGGSKTRLYNVWSNMRRRCYDEKNNRYHNYGGRGIRVCDEWMNFAKFRDWAISTGYNENAQYGECTLDRINVDGDYEPSNCAWRTIQQQNINRKSNHILYHNGISLPISEWESKMGYRKGLIDNRIRKGWDVDRAIETLPERRA